MANAQARAIAESGVERTLWALTKGETDPAANGALIDPLPAPVPAPYDGSQLVNLGVGQLKVTVTNGPAVNERTIEAVGYVPNAANPIAIKKLETVVTKVKTLDPPCAVCAGGEAPNDRHSGWRLGLDQRRGHRKQLLQRCHAIRRDVLGGDGGNERPSGHHRSIGRVGDDDRRPAVELHRFPLQRCRHGHAEGAGEGERNVLPGQSGVDVAAAQRHHLRRHAVRQSAVVDIHGNWSQGWNGWLVVAGTIAISGNTTLNGLIYAQNDVDLHGAGGGSITGAVISTNRIDSQSTNVDTEDVGNAPISYNCRRVRDGGGFIPQGWFVKPGTYRDVDGTT